MSYSDKARVFLASHGMEPDGLDLEECAARFIADMETVRALAKAGQIATQYVNAAGEPTMDIDGNPNGSVCAIEGITSPDGRVFGRMAHAERTGAQLYRNVPGNQDSGIFRGAVDYFRD